VPSPVLLAYSTFTGSTAEVAEAIAETLRNAQLTVDLARMRDLETLGQYRAVILGAPLYLGELPSEVHRFLSRHRRYLAGIPVWVFVLGPVLGKPEEFNAAGEQVSRQIDRSPWLLPVEVKILGGRFNAGHVPFPYNFVRHFRDFTLADAPSSDIRDWEDIRSWAANIAKKIEQAESLAGSLSQAN
jgi:menaquinone-dependent protoporphyrinogen oxidase